VPVYALGDYEPEIHETAFVHPDAVVIGRVRIGPEASVWPCAVLRGDHGRIEVGSGSVTLNRAKVGTGAIVAASCLVPEGFEVPPGALVAGVPAKIKKTGLTPDWVDGAVKTYIESGRAYRTGLRRLELRDRP